MAAHSVVAVLLVCLLVALPTPTHASRALRSELLETAEDATGGSARSLLQTPNATDCARSVPNCVACRFVAGIGGSTSTKAYCTKCDVGYGVKNGGRGCCKFLIDRVCRISKAAWRGGSLTGSCLEGGWHYDPCAAAVGLPGLAANWSTTLPPQPTPAHHQLTKHTQGALQDTTRVEQTNGAIAVVTAVLGCVERNRQLLPWLPGWRSQTPPSSAEPCSHLHISSTSTAALSAA